HKLGHFVLQFGNQFCIIGISCSLEFTHQSERPLPVLLDSGSIRNRAGVSEWWPLGYRKALGNIFRADRALEHHSAFICSTAAHNGKYRQGLVRVGKQQLKVT